MVDLQCENSIKCPLGCMWTDGAWTLENTHTQYYLCMNYSLWSDLMCFLGDIWSTPLLFVFLWDRTIRGLEEKKKTFLTLRDMMRFSSRVILFISNISCSYTSQYLSQMSSIEFTTLTNVFTWALQKGHRGPPPDLHGIHGNILGLLL